LPTPHYVTFLEIESTVEFENSNPGALESFLIAEGSNPVIERGA
jgi:hypothetical protein